MRLRMLKHFVGKGRHVMKQLHVCLIVLQYDAIVATERAGYVLYRALVIMHVSISVKRKKKEAHISLLEHVIVILC